MKKLVLIGILILGVTAALGQTEEYPHVMDNGGGRISDGTHNNLASIGQAVAGISDDGSNTNQAGYITAVSWSLNVEENKTELSTENLKILRNYPNPFKKRTNIEFILSEDTKVKFSVHDITGKKLFTESRERMPAGKHRISFEADDLPSGIYLYRLKTDNVERTNKMIIAK